MFHFERREKIKKNGLLDGLYFIVVTCFLLKNFILFYFFFEIVLFPIVLLVYLFGYQPERAISSTYMLLYTLGASLPLLLFFLKRWADIHVLDMGLLSLLKNKSLRYFVIFIILIAFLVKLPIYFFHLWLPKAHVEAPLRGSIILAGLLLKLGGYGLYRISCVVIGQRSYSFCRRFFSISLVGGLIVSFICFIQQDIKAFIAYSSVRHMSLVIIRFFTQTSVGRGGSLRLMIRHGLCSSCIFYISNIFYQSTLRRNLYFYGGFISISIIFRYTWFLANVVNIGAPPTINFFREVLIMITVLRKYMARGAVSIFVMIAVAFYSVVLFTKTSQGAS